MSISPKFSKMNSENNNMQIIKETDISKLPVKNDKETLMIYTCYPFNNIGYTKQRYVVYANLVE